MRPTAAAFILGPTTEQVGSFGCGVVGVLMQLMHLQGRKLPFLVGQPLSVERTVRAALFRQP